MSLSAKVKACYVNFILMLVTGVITYVSGFVLWLAIPRGQVRGRPSAGDAFLGLSRGEWEYVHIATSLVLLVLTVIHLALNWAWIRNVTRCLLSSLGKG